MMFSVVQIRPLLLVLSRKNIFHSRILRHFSSSSIEVRSIEPIPMDEIRKRTGSFESPPDGKISKTVILGCPNAGKSVLTNALIDLPISAVSSKVHTTRKTTRGSCLLDDRTQLLVLDTPGVVTSTKAKKHKLEDSLLLDPEGAMLGADTACVVVDAADKYTRDRLDPRLLHLLYRHRHRMTSVLVLTKTDTVKNKRLLLDLATKLTKGIVNGQQAPVREANLLMTGGSELSKQDTKLDSKDGSTEDIEVCFETTASSAIGNENVTVDNSIRTDNSTTEKELGIGSVDETLKKYWTGVKWNILDSIAELPWPQVQESMLQKCYRDEIGWPLFDRIFMLSALNGVGVDELRMYLNDRAKSGKWRFHPSVCTDQDPVELVKSVVRAKLMDRLKYHIPYTLEFKVCVWEVNEDDVLCIRMDVLTRQDRDGKLIIGSRGKTVGEVAQEVCQVLRNLFQREVFFRLGVYTVRK